MLTSPPHESLAVPLSMFLSAVVSLVTWLVLEAFICTNGGSALETKDDQDLAPSSAHGECKNWLENGEGYRCPEGLAKGIHRLL